MPPPVLNLDGVVNAIDRAVGLQDSAVAFIQASGDVLKDAVRAALEADDAADQGSIDAAMAAIDLKVAEQTAASDRLAAALAANPGDTPPAARRR